ncbi:hypothetical protein CXB51_026098 [Gossypium anomalum]|uniref:Reverse transcriptase domain-containing protein n=1 Tax=Gossypium anomalum TaxID=47600 RepID=A0A8J5YB00_9ROSI|nr:hypothetical protein CXB51_026098 [Gossypium anomalum]
MRNLHDTRPPNRLLPPILQEGIGGQVNTVGNFSGPPQRPYNPYSNTYNLGWRDHPNFSYAQNQRSNQTYQPRTPPPQPYKPPKSSLESLVERLVQSQEKFQDRTESHFQEIDKQISQLAKTVGRLESQGKLPSQTEAIPRENMSAITLRSGIIVEQQMTPIREKNDTETSKNDKAIKDNQAEEKEILDVIQKVKINIPLLEVIRKVPRYARFLKELCTNKKRLTGHEKVNLREHVSAILTRRLPPKLKDQGMFAIPYKIDKVGIKRAMCNLRASINVMPLSVYNTLSADPLKEIKVTIQLANRSIIYPEGVLENVLVKVNELIFSADFYVIDMENDRSNTSSEILLRRPFLSTTNTKIDVRSGILTMEFDGEVVKFNVYKAMRYPDDVQSINFVDIIEPAIDKFVETNFVIKFAGNSMISMASRIELKELPDHLKYFFGQR